MRHLDLVQNPTESPMERLVLHHNNSLSPETQKPSRQILLSKVHLLPLCLVLSILIRERSDSSSQTDRSRAQCPDALERRSGIEGGGLMQLEGAIW